MGFSISGRSSVKGHKSSVKEGNALYLDGLQYSNKEKSGRVVASGWHRGGFNINMVLLIQVMW